MQPTCTVNASAVAKSGNVYFFAMAPEPTRSQPPCAAIQVSTVAVSSLLGRLLMPSDLGRMPVRRPPRTARYAPSVLVACPFCREMFAPGERSQCPVCGVALVPIDRLPPSADAIAEDGIPHQPEHDRLPLA